MWSTRMAAAAAATLAIGLAAAACGGDSGDKASGAGQGGFPVPKVAMQKSLGQGEGQVNLVAWAGYAEDGSNDPKVDWVTPFEKQTGCKVNTKVAGTSDEMVTLMKTGEYDAVSASGDASLRLIASGTVAPVNTGLVPNYADIFAGLKMKPWNSVNNVAYGIPHGRGANLLMWRTDKVKTVPDSWGAVFDANSPYKGKITAYDSPIYIADAALYLKTAKPELGIKDPYALDQKQFDAAVELLKTQHGLVGEYWSDYTKEVQAFKSGDSVLGTTWQVIANLAKGEKAPVEVALPKEGSTGWSDTWMVGAKAKHPNCAYKWMDWIVSPKANAQVAEWFGEAPANAKACRETADKTHCDTFHATDENYFSKVHFWTTPIAQCLDGRKDVKCVDYSKWTQAWTTIKG
ncbi:putative spermidine/putrescine transport system substrate-binding protein [Actinomadura luteofluorescens]|uniref:Putative spermidine/putrescine transport system substrate-binding protein n=2 Tax=Actinomadura luteofluorescens TaxID=46163 RepID=A0A7Y9JEJ2_9ACTN|nr:ABC transporter substrate-binding protein [Actinomadura luteofluorescens]NYD45516.1 putative spermidine/putrescine transport system substrate-binding protein [Actinomadura luteofluorescens]